MNKALLFGLDGATFDILDPLIARGLMPNLGRFLEEGARGLLESTVPPLTPIAWTSMVTGRRPGHHGVLGFFQYDSAHSSSLRIVSSREVRTETVWAMANRFGARTACLNFPVHCPPPRVDGWVIPGWVPWKWIKSFSHPRGVMEQLQHSVPDLDLKALAMDFEQEKKSIAGAPIDNYEEWITLHCQRDRQWFNVLRRALKDGDCRLTGIVFDGVDKLQHLLWPFLDPRLEPAQPDERFLRIRELCWVYYQQIDQFLGEAMELAGSDATIVIASDHGFTGSDQIVFINTWLEREGFLAWKPKMDIVAEDDYELEPDFYQLSAFDMSNTRAYALTASSNGIHIVVRGKRSDAGVAPSEYFRFRERLRQALLTRCVDPSTGAPLIERVWLREEIFDGPAMEQAPDLTLTLRDNGFFSVRRGQQIVMRRPQTMGTHHPLGILAARGPGIRAGTHLATARLADVTPTLLYALDIPIPDGLDGRVVSGLFTAEHRSARPVRSVRRESLVLSAVGEQDTPMPPPDDPEVMERLRALGYIE